jgi:protease-4
MNRHDVSRAFRRLRVAALNLARRQRRLPRFVRLTLSGEIDEIPPTRPDFPFAHWLLPPPPPSVSSLRYAFERLAADPRVEGAVLEIACRADLATFQSLRQLVLDFRAGGKRAIAWATGFGPFQYYLACACDQIIMPPGAEWSVVGLQREYVFLKDALAELGLSVDVFNVSPFKSAGDQFARTGFSDEARAQAEALLDAAYAELVRGMAQGRRMSEEQARAAIEAAPMSAADAVQAGLLDAALHEDELEARLAPGSEAPPAAQAPGLARRLARRQPRVLGRYEEARRALLLPAEPRADKMIGVVTVDGLIVEGASQALPASLPVPWVGSRTAGADSVGQALRRAEHDDAIAAVVLNVNSGGGGALASDLIAREVKRVRHKKPVVAYLAGVAASGGYFVAAPASAIIAQPLTITGSIGVVVLRPNAEGMDSRLKLHRVTLRRGGRTGLLSASRALSDDEREATLASMGRAYADFKRAVAEGRRLDEGALEPLCGGRVWTGAQALERGLVDELGGFDRAVDRARELAGLPAAPKVIAVWVPPPRQPMLPPRFPAPAGLWEWLTHPGARLANLAGRARVWRVMPWQVERWD